MRGKPGDPAFPPHAPGITPAGAGKTITASGHKSSSVGSPPQVRGKLKHNIAKRILSGITPAGAGKTSRRKVERMIVEDHPRRCGENFRDKRKDPDKLGSPPQVRGKRTYPKAFAAGAGITPAGAGKTKRRKQKRTLSWDHPRRCGENAGQNPNIVRHLGSPPQVRGKRASGGAESPRKRITPAGAGKTHRAIHYPRSGRDHPRRCGENSGGVSARHTRLGSPPQVRGKLTYPRYSVKSSRITPADAGKTFCSAFIG